MYSLVNFKSASTRILFDATRVSTFEWFLTSMSCLMRLQMSFGNKTNVAHVAHEWALPSMRPDMCFKVSCF